MNQCSLCAQDTFTPDERLDHLTQLLEDTGVLHALVLIHGLLGGRRLYVQRGGRVHLDDAETAQLQIG